MIRIVFLIFLLPVLSSAKSYVYRMTTGSFSNTTVYWTEDYSDIGFIKVYATNGRETYDALCQTNYEAVKWLYRDTDNDTDLTGERRKNILFFSGKSKGTEVNRIVPIDADPVFQTISFSLGEFLRSDRDTASFWFIIPGDYSPFKMNAIREDGKRIVKVNNVAVECYGIKVTLEGPWKAFWYSMYYYRTFDLTYVKYEGINGGPGTPVTTVELIGEEDNGN